MSLSDADAIHYVGILEAVVAVLAIKSGLDPNTMMARAIEDITEQTGMETADTERIIRERWNGRQLQAGHLAQQLVLAQQSRQAQSVPQTVVMPDASTRLQEYKKRLSEASSESGPPNP